jgi:membrane protein implicated in regulation of membrane protease activity
MEWAAAQRSTDDLPTWEDVFRRRSRRFEWTDIAMLAAVVIAIAAGVATRGQGDSMEAENWQWIWVGAALFLGFAEMLTAGFFLLPFAIGAVLAAGLAFAGVTEAWQLTAFIVASVASLVVIQRYVRKVDEVQHPVGANRFAGQTALVLEAVDRTTGNGRVRMATEVWRATTDGAEIPVGTEVRIVEVRGARLVVAPLEES